MTLAGKDKLHPVWPVCGSRSETGT